MTFGAGPHASSCTTVATTELHAKQSEDSEISIRHAKAGSFQNGGAKFETSRKKTLHTSRKKH